jgi:2-methylisocitrate lyase-like PEP mutase family enzyme
VTAAVLRSLHVPGRPLVLPNAWDAGTARLVVEAGFPVVATSSAAVAESLGYADHEDVAVAEMFAAVRRIARAVDVPVTVDAEAGYGMEPNELVAALKHAGAAGCNLEETDHRHGALRDPAEHAAWLRAVRDAADADGYGLVVNARIDVFLSDRSGVAQAGLVPDAVRRAHAYLDAGADCVYPIALWERPALAAFLSEAGGPVNVLASERAPSLAELAGLGAARVSYGTRLHREAMDGFRAALRELA